MTATDTKTRTLTPRVQPGKTALRIGSGRHTVDIVSTDGALLAVIGDGVGRPPAASEIGPAVVAAVIQVATIIDEDRTAFETQAWPLTEP